MTPDDYKTKWCPMVRAKGYVPEIGEITANCLTADRNPEWARCIGPECAVWEEIEAVNVHGKYIPEGTGYCGLRRSQHD